MAYLQFLRLNAPWLAAAFLLTFSSGYGQTFFISIFAGEIRTAFGLSHGAWGGIYAAGTLASAAVMIWAGMLADRFRVRALGAVVLSGLAVACLAMAANRSALLLIGVIFLLRLFGQGMAAHTGMVAVARWFLATRGKALTIAALGLAAANAILPLAFVALLPVLGWRGEWVLAAALSLAAIPAMFLLLRHERTPRSVAATTHAAGMSNRHWTRADALRHRLFWLLLPTLLGPSAWGTALFFQQVHLTEIKGWPLVEFVALFPLFTVATVLTNIAIGWAVDRVGANRLMPFLLVPWIATFAVLASATTLLGAMLGLALMGVAMGLGAVLPGAFLAEHYGTRHIGSIKALTTAVMVLGSAIGPGATGLLIDLGVDFDRQMLGFAAYFGLASLLLAAAALGARPLLAAPKVDVERAVPAVPLVGPDNFQDK